MKLHDFVILFLVMFLVLSYSNDVAQSYADETQFEQKKYSNNFRTAVDDVGKEMTKLEAQQLTGPLKYGADKQLSVDKNLLTYFYNNLSAKFGILGDPYKTQELMLHIPVMVQVKYDGYNLITVDYENTSGGDLAPVTWPTRPFSYTIDGGKVINFTMDDYITGYDPATNTFFKGKYDDLVKAWGAAYFSPLTTKQLFLDVRTQTVTDLVQRDIEGSINKHLELAKRSGNTIKFSMPTAINEQSIQGVGFLAYINGYPLPGGELLTDYAFGKAEISLRDRLTGVKETTGRLNAYGPGCAIPVSAKKQEILFDRTEAVRKGYYIVDCK